jgi:hypothetical protein
MPRISEFHGIVITMYWDDHLPPHFHAQHGEFDAAIAIDDRDVLEGKLPRHILRKVREWASLHQAELAADWDLARHKRPLNPIAPLV